MKCFLRKTKAIGIMILIANLFFANAAFGQAVGDYRTQGTGGNWGTLASWERLNALPATWAIPTAGQGYPGENAVPGTVTILNNHNVTLNVSPANSIGSLVMAGGGNATLLNFSLSSSLNAGDIIINSGTTLGDDKTIAVAGGSLTCSSVTMAATGDDNRTNFLTVSTGSITVSGSITMNDADVDRNIVRITGIGSINIAGNFTGGNLVTAANSTVNYNGAAQEIRNVTYNGNIITSGSGTKTLIGNTIINDNLTIGAGTTLLVTEFNFTVIGATTIDGTLTSNSTTGTKIFDNLILNATGAFNSTVDEDYTLTGSLAVHATATLTSGAGIWTFNGNSTISGTAAITTAVFSNAYSNSGNYSFSSLTKNGTGNFTNNGTISASTILAGTSAFVQGVNAILNFGGASITITTFTAIAAGNTVNYNGGVQAVRAVAYQNLTLSGTGAKTVTGSTINGTLSMQGTASATGTSPTFGAAATLEYAGSAAQTTTDVEFKSAAVSPFNVIINNSNGVTLHAARSINGKLTLTNGIFYLPAGTIFTIANGNTNTVGGAPFSATKYIATQVNYTTGAKGFLRVNNMAAATAYLFPAGDGINYLPVTLTPGGTLANNTFSVCSFEGLTANGEPNGTPFTLSQKHNTVDAVWTVNYHGAGNPTAPSADMTVAWPASLEGVNFQNYGGIIIGIAHYGPAIWGTAVGSGNNVLNTATRTNITEFSPFGVGNIDPAGGPLAITINYFNALKGNNVNSLYWKATCTSSFAKFNIERSTDGVNFSSITVVTATQERCSLPFSYNDYTAPSGNVYYRIRIIDADGKVTYSAIVKLGSPVNKMELVGFTPNPVTGSMAQLKINSSKPGTVNLMMIALDGRIMQRHTVQLQPGSSIINLDMANLPAGAYMIKGLFSDGESNAIKFIKQ